MLTHRRATMLRADEVWQLDHGELRRLDSATPATGEPT